MSDTAPPLLSAMSGRVVVADGAMGTTLQASAATLDDFGGHEGCNEILNETRPDIVRSVHDGYLAAGVDCITTNSFGADLANLGRSGSGRTPAGRRRSVRQWRPAATTTASRSPASRPGTARTCSTSAWTTWAGTAPEQATDALVVHHPEAKYFSA
jgi:methionine synthase I (cobalamin-dependent)